MGPCPIEMIKMHKSARINLKKICHQIAYRCCVSCVWEKCCNSLVCLFISSCCTNFDPMLRQNIDNKSILASYCVESLNLSVNADLPCESTGFSYLTDFDLNISYRINRRNGKSERVSTRNVW